jgi:hypothetical protein
MLRRWRELAVPTALGLFLLLAWDRSVVWLNIKPMMLPRPAAVLDVLLTHTALLREHGWATISDAGLALLRAGFAMMGGTSQHGLVNIGAGANVGVEDYVKGRDKLDAARERLDDAFDRLAQVRRGELIMNQKEQAQLQRDVNNTITQTEKDVLAGAQQAYGWKKDDARAAYTAYVADRRTGAELVSKERLGLAQIAAQKEIANMLPGETRTAMFFGKGDTPQAKFLSGMKVITEATADKTGMSAVKLLTEANTKREAAGQPPLTMQDLLASAREYNMLMYPKETSVPPKGAPVLKQ